jgi:hypothetical protein
MLFFCKNANHCVPHDSINLATCTTVKSADLKTHKPHSFEISTPELCYLFYADSETDKDDWIGRVGKAIVRCSRTYHAQPASNTTTQYHHEDDHHRHDSNEDDLIYTNDDPNNPYFND